MENNRDFYSKTDFTILHLDTGNNYLNKDMFLLVNGPTKRNRLNEVDASGSKTSNTPKLQPLDNTQLNLNYSTHQGITRSNPTNYFPAAPPSLKHVHYLYHKLHQK